MSTLTVTKAGPKLGARVEGIDLILKDLPPPADNRPRQRPWGGSSIG